MKLLILTHKPEGASFRQRIGLYLDALRGAKVESEVEVLPPSPLRRRRMLRSASSFDAVLLHRKTLNWLDARTLRRFGRAVIYDFDDAIMYRASRPGAASAKRRHAFDRTVGIADLVIAGNSYLADRAREGCRHVEVLPTGLCVSDYAPAVSKGEQDRPIRLVWIGSRSTLKYLRLLVPVLEELGQRLPGLVLRIIADDFLELEHMKVEKKTWSLETQYADLATADIGIAPLPDNAYTRGKCGFKILQYMAASLPVIASPVGVNGEYVREGESGFHASEAEQWIDATEKLVHSPELRKTMGAAGRDIVRTHYDREALAPRFCELVTQAMAARGQT
ncbi:MAG: glycosyltransferase family 4 protein [Phycisphaerae bacterium]|nr:glycosyltransferase family 4 protein [Phycisphaerae bacterium]